jgi:hypothetical protein
MKISNNERKTYKCIMWDKPLRKTTFLLLGEVYLSNPMGTHQ